MGGSQLLSNLMAKVEDVEIDGWIKVKNFGGGNLVLIADPENKNITIDISGQAPLRPRKSADPFSKNDCFVDGEIAENEVLSGEDSGSFIGKKSVFRPKTSHDKSSTEEEPH